MTKAAKGGPGHDPGMGTGRVNRRGARARTPPGAILPRADCIRILDPDGRVLFTSARGLTISEIDRNAAMSGRIWWDLWPDDMSDKVQAAFRTAMCDIDCTFRGNWNSRRGAVNMVEVTVRPILAGDGNIAYALSRSRELREPTVA